ncbi:hypothetical protein N8329_00365 [Crocinitomicaceae bacterium]|nr:hypothetical protein [Crocinitomicaceae bacterium]
MNKTLSEEVKQDILKGQFPKNYQEFGGAKLIVTKDMDASFRDEESLTIIRTEHASAISWLIDRIKTIYNLEISKVNKYDFYEFIGESIQSSINRGNDVFEVMELMLEDAESYFEN